MVTHERAALRHASRRVTLVDGRVVADERSDEAAGDGGQLAREAACA
jgi:ABC-type bacteriocin/lantibiotic exporter with double-glycine peptidase domain